MEKSFVVGDENDDELLESIVKVLKEMGAQKVSSDRVVIGSQDLQTLRVNLAGQMITVEAETYIGVTIISDEALVDEVVRRLQRCAPRNT